MPETSTESKQHLATFVMKHPALEAVQEGIKRKLFDRWLRGTPEEQKIIRDVSDNMQLFFSELAALAADAVDLNDNEDS